MGMLWIYITNPSRAAAEKVGMHLLKKRLAACINIFPITSAYLWKGKIARGKEWILVVKSIVGKEKAVEKEVEKVHPYTVPCIIAFKPNVNKKYEKWLKSEIRTK